MTFRSPFPDLTKDPTTILMDMLNTINAQTLPQPLALADCVFGDPSPYGGDGANTQIMFGTTNPAVFGAGQVRVLYTRIDLAALDATQPALSGASPTVADVIAALNSTYGLELTSDLVSQSASQALTENEDGTFTQVLSIVGGDMIYTGTQTFTFAPEPVGVPTANYSSSTSGLAVTFTDSSSSTNGATITGWAWTFGDDGTASTQNPSHTYAAVGTYSIGLTVTDSTGQTASKTGSVTLVGQPTANFSSVVDHQSVTFTDSSTDLAGASVTGWSWDFGDGNSSTEQNPVHAYTEANTFSVKLTVTDSTSQSASKTLDVTTVGTPVANYSSAVAAQTVTFTDTSTDVAGASIASWAWDFGDSQSSTEQNPVHDYEAAGTFTAKLTVTDSTGQTADKSTSVVTKGSPVASFTSVPTDLDVAFTDTSTDVTGATITGWAWDFGDGTGTSTDQNPSYTYAAAGTFTVILTVTDSTGQTSAAATNDVTVAAA